MGGMGSGRTGGNPTDEATGSFILRTCLEFCRAVRLPPRVERLPGHLGSVSVGTPGRRDGHRAQAR